MANLEWWKAIVNILKAHYPETVDLQTIYLEVRQHRTLVDNNLKMTYGQVNYQHTVRSILTRLVKEGSVERVKRATLKNVTTHCFKNMATHFHHATLLSHTTRNIFTNRIH